MTFEIAILVIIVAGFIGLFFALRRKEQEPKDDQPLLMLQNQLNEVTRTIGDVTKTVDAKLGESTRILQSQFGESAKIIRDVTERLTKLDETNRQVISFADQLKNLQDILKNPKQRGIVGEYYLQTVLENVLPPGTFKMQYPFKDGTIVDAAIFVKEKIIAVDSKFPLENYNRIIETNDAQERERLGRAFRQDLKNRIDETSKYVKPAEDTMDFAFMFIPAEAVFYDLLINKIGLVDTEDLIEYAFRKHVIIVSPTSFLAYLQTVLQGLRALQIEESAKEIRKRVEDLGRHLGSYDVFMAKLGKNLETTVNAYNTASKELGKVDKDVLRITGQGIELEPLVIAKPDSGDE